MFEHAICHAVALTLSFHNAAEGDDWRNEQSARWRADSAWEECRSWLYRRGELKEFMGEGNYLLPGYATEAAAAERSINSQEG